MSEATQPNAEDQFITQLRSSLEPVFHHDAGIRINFGSNLPFFRLALEEVDATHFPGSDSVLNATVVEEAGHSMIGSIVDELGDKKVSVIAGLVAVNEAFSNQGQVPENPVRSSIVWEQPKYDPSLFLRASYVRPGTLASRIIDENRADDLVQTEDPDNVRKIDELTQRRLKNKSGLNAQGRAQLMRSIFSLGGDFDRYIPKPRYELEVGRLTERGFYGFGPEVPRVRRIMELTTQLELIETEGN